MIITLYFSSTETQTDEMEILPRLTNDDAFNMIEAQTQFDLDDILCSNYTQTALFDASLDQNSIGVSYLFIFSLFVYNFYRNIKIVQ